LLRECDADGSETFTFDECLELIGRVRTHQKAVREARLRREFARYVKLQDAAPATSEDIDTSSFAEAAAVHRERVQWMSSKARKKGEDFVDTDRLYGLLSAVGLAGKTSIEREIVTLVIGSSCGTFVSFPQFQEVCQAICEALAREEVQEQYSDAEALGIPTSRLHKFQEAFDHVRTKDYALINSLDLPKVLEKVLLRPPPKQAVYEMLEAISTKNCSKEISFKTFLHLMHRIFTGSPLLVKEAPYTIEGVPTTKLREILRLFALAPEYVDEVAAAELPDLLASFLNVLPTTNLRELSQPVSNIRQLRALAQKRSAVRGEIRGTESHGHPSDDAIRNHLPDLLKD